MASANGGNAPGGQDAARQELVRSHLPLVRAMARRYARRPEELDDLVQAGSVGLVKASVRFDPSRGVAFATFVAPSVEGEIRRHLRDRSDGVRMPREVQRMSTELRRIRSELAASLGRPPDVRELAAVLDADVREVEHLIAADLAKDPVPLDGGEPVPEALADGGTLDKSEFRVLLAGSLRALDPRERRIVFLRFHADMTERQIARTLGISQSHVSRLLEGALSKLRTELTRSTDGDAAGNSTEKAVISPDSKPEAEPQEEVAAAEDREARAADTGPPAAQRATRSRSTGGYSGRILVRMPSELHEQLSLAAEREEISLNRFVNDALSSSVDGPGSDPGDADEDAPSSPRVSARAIRMAVVTNLAIVVIAAIAAVVLLVLALQRGV